MSIAKKTFLLGVGAQKAGTTWLHAYLSNSNICDMGLLKEYHVWDALEVPELKEYDIREKTSPVFRRLKSEISVRFGGKPNRLEFRKSLQRSPQKYFRYFARTLSTDGIFLSGDFTPSYSGLPVDTLLHIKNEFKTLDIGVKAIFLMRDPIGRALSAVRMYHRDKLEDRNDKTNFQGVNMTLEPDAALVPYLETSDWRLRGDYSAILNRLEAVFDPQDLYLGFYETMFTNVEFARLNAFLGTEPDATFQTRRFNATSKAAPLAPEIRGAAMQRLGTVYETVFARWPEMRDHWIQPDTTT